MDPVTAAGLGLSVTSLTLQLFSSCIKSYQVLLDAVEMPARFQHIRVRMRLEQTRLLHWGDKIGLLTDTFEEPSLLLRLHHNLIFDILLEVSQLFAACLKIEGKFAPLLPSKAVSQASYSFRNSTGLSGQSTETLLAKATGLLHRSTELPKRLEWAMIKQDKFEKLIEQLISYNDSMLSLLDDISLQQVRQAQIQSGLTLLQLSTKIDSLKQLIQATQIRSASDVYTSVVASHMQARPHLGQLLDGRLGVSNDDLGLERLATFKVNRLDIEQVPASTDGTMETDPSVVNMFDMADIHDVVSTSRIDTAVFRGEAVWLEWKECDQQNKNPWYKQVLDLRVQKLAALLSIRDTPQEFRCPKCLGYVREIEDDVVRYGFINRTPPIVSKTIPPMSLLESLKNERKPSLSQRVRLAHVLASGLMYLHSVNWLHKGFRSDNIIFFPDTEGHIDWDSPTISGFEYARPDQPGEMTEKPQAILEHDIYRHPDSTDDPRARSQKSWDIYSLGIVLIEIGAWKSIGEIADVDYNHHRAKSKVRRVRDFVLQDEFLNQVGVECGDRYREVVRLCLTGGSSVGAVAADAQSQAVVDESDPEVGSRMIRIFAQDIVGVLKGIHV